MSGTLKRLFTASLLKQALALEAWQEVDGPLTRSVAYRSVQNYSFTAMDIDSQLSTDPLVETSSYEFLVETGWYQIYKTDTVVFHLALEVSSSDRDLPDELTLGWQLPPIDYVYEDPKWEYGLIEKQLVVTSEEGATEETIEQQYKLT